jgi:hypothetical protein
VKKLDKLERAQPKEAPNPEIMTTKDLAKFLRLHEITVQKYAAAVKIPATRMGKAGDLTRRLSIGGSRVGEKRNNI